MATEPLIFHIDVNSAYLSWESVRRLEEDSSALDLRTIPSAVGGDASLRHGIVLAKSTPAKAFGISTGESISQALRKCPSLTVVPARFDVYLKKSEQLMEILSDYTPDMEKFSIDEAFLDMSSTIHLFGPPLVAANRIRERIWRELGFTVNIGVAPNKLLAKMASDFKKPNLCHTLFTHEISSKMWPLPIGDLFFVGHSARKKLEGIGIHTIGELASCSISHLKPLLGEKYALLIHDYAWGIDSSPVAERESFNKGYGNSTTLSHDIDDFDVACQVLLSLSETVGARLRTDHVMSDCICVEIKDWNFQTRSHQITLNNPTDSTAVIYENACKLLKELWDRTPLRLIGVRTTKISEEGYFQLNLFESEHTRKMKEMEKAVDRIRSKFGTDSVKRASFLKKDAIVDHTAGRGKSGIK
ncbi:DNA polymerase Y family protein [Lacrimispora saccharolytica]|uniref:DNA polymerase IV n=1 Tax=Lacrimispora saccharolytica (strain ATCC 35040 / DSM 2544 / NRCC 2533 / WM1) TaxID=610130 RepID=D9R8U8_LACSW|nr:DNA polymerase IV [Lacrimispora saccharolytica]ADL03923.1 DNA-directed DNA polymerase [[Clostridium] saccharolyticum WM1]QRV21767.1 DNA polymerase IV [Lacrimispora saccharolytica]